VEAGDGEDGQKFFLKGKIGGPGVLARGNNGLVDPRIFQVVAPHPPPFVPAALEGAEQLGADLSVRSGAEAAEGSGDDEAEEA
jgi:hypothetical protein